MTPTADDSFTDKEIADMAQAISDNGFQYESNKDRLRTALQAAPEVVTVKELKEEYEKMGGAFIDMLPEWFPHGIKIVEGK